MNKFLNKVLGILALLSFAFGLSACGGKSDEEVQRADADKARLVASERQAAAAERELGLIKAAAAKLERQAVADKRVNELARTAVRTSQLTDKAGCSIIPASLVADPAASEFGQRMTERYPATCRQQVADYRAERRAVAAAERAKGVKLAQEAEHAKGAKVAKVDKPAPAKAKSTDKTSVKPVSQTR